MGELLERGGGYAKREIVVLPQGTKTTQAQSFFPFNMYSMPSTSRYEDLQKGRGRRQSSLGLGCASRYPLVVNSCSTEHRQLPASLSRRFTQNMQENQSHFTRGAIPSTQALSYASMGVYEDLAIAYLQRQKKTYTYTHTYRPVVIAESDVEIHVSTLRASLHCLMCFKKSVTPRAPDQTIRLDERLNGYIHRLRHRCAEQAGRAKL